MKKNQDRINHLFAVLSSYARNEADTKLILNFTDKRETTDHEIIIELSCAITNGLLYGNWPWIIAELNARKG